jgi:hypothetical protein
MGGLFRGSNSPPSAPRGRSLGVRLEGGREAYGHALMAGSRGHPKLKLPNTNIWHGRVTAIPSGAPFLLGLPIREAFYMTILLRGVNTLQLLQSGPRMAL